MTSPGTMIWAGDDATTRELLRTMAAEVGLAVRFCSPQDVADSAAARDRVIGIEADADPAAMIALVAELHDDLPHAGFLLAVHDPGRDFVREALKAGASNVLSLPLDHDELHKALLCAMHVSVRTRGALDSLGDVITVCGARGGLGATTLAVNLASRLASVTGAETALVDLDLQRGDVATFLNLTPLVSIGNFATAPGEVDDLFLSSTLTRHPNGVFVLPAPPEIEDAESVGHREVKVALDLLRAQFRYTVVDTARTITGATAAAVEASTRILLLADLTVPGVRAARRVVGLLERLGVPPERIELVVTEVVRGPVKMDDAVRIIGRRPLFVIPRDEASAGDAMNQGAPLNGQPSKLAIAVTQLAAKLAGVATASKPRPGQFLRRLFTRTEGVHP